jgi:RNAse (barnase) inhibitor barstar
MKVLKLHPLMTVSLLQMQFQRLLSCNIAVYMRNSPANAFATLQEAGFPEEMLIEFPIDETLSLREFEEELEDKFNFTLELCNKDNKPFTNKSMHLFQLIASLSDNMKLNNEYHAQLDITIDRLLNNNRQGPQQIAC